MYLDPDGKFGILVTLLITTSIGAVIGAGINLGKQLILGRTEFSDIDWCAVGAAALTGGATGLAYGLGGVAGGIAKGALATLGNLSIYQSVGLLATTALVTNFAAGMGAYALRQTGDNKTNINIISMALSGVGQMLKGGLSFVFGGIMSGSGIWKIGKGIKSQFSPISRAIARSSLTAIPNHLIDKLFNDF